MPPYVTVAGLTLLIIATTSAFEIHSTELSLLAVKSDMQPGALWIVNAVLFVSDSNQEDKPQLGYRSRVLCAVSLN